MQYLKVYTLSNGIKIFTAFKNSFTVSNRIRDKKMSCFKKRTKMQQEI